MADRGDLARRTFEGASELERELRAAQKKLAPSAPEVQSLLERLRKAYDDILFLDFAFASEEAQDVEGALWMKVHHKTIENYKARLSKFQATHGKSRPVEYRKLLANFTNFIKDATKYYRTLIQRLIIHFQVSELEYVIKTFGSTAVLPSHDVSYCAPDLSLLVIRASHVILVHLGDLSRYKELYTTNKESKKNWGPALGYYQFARRVLPSAGMPMNQLAVVAIYTENVLASTYYFLRAACATEGFPTSQDNLILGFKKFLKKPQKTNETNILDLYMRVVAGIYVQDHYEDLHNDLSKLKKSLASHITDRLISSDVLSQFACINFGLLQLVKKRDGAVPAAIQQVRHDHYTRLAVTIIKQLLDNLSKELSAVAENSEDLVSQVSAVMRRLLPTLRLCSKWMKLNLTSVRPLWTAYVQAMTLCGSKFPRNLLPALSEPLSEDVDMRGFSPLSGGLSGSALGGPSSSAHPNNEMLVRLSDLLADAIEIAQLIDAELSQSSPTVDTSNANASNASAVNAHARSASRSSISGAVPHRQSLGAQAPAEHARRNDTTDQLDAQEMPLSLGKMVDSLVEPDEEEELVFKGRRHASNTHMPNAKVQDITGWTNGYSPLPPPKTGNLWST